MPRWTTPTGLGGWLTLLLGVLLAVIGLILTVGGVQLAALGGSWYYVLAGLALIASGVLLILRDIRGAWIYAATFAATLIWAFWEKGLNGWAQVPRLVGPLVGGPGDLRPGKRAFVGPADDLRRRGQRRTHVEHHLDVGAEQLLGVHRDLRCEPVRRAVVRAAEGDAVVVDLRLEREHLEAARVGEDGAVPAREPVEPADGAHHVEAKPVCVA